MSTYISGYIMRNISLKKLVEFNIKHKIEIEKIKKQTFRKKLIGYYIKEYDEMTFNIIKKTDNVGKNILATIIDDIKYELYNPKAKLFNKYWDINFNTIAIYYPLNRNNMLVRISGGFTEESEYINTIKEFSDYSYQDSCDKPNDISNKAWNKRLKDWDIVFKNDVCKNGYGDINGGGLHYQFCDNIIVYSDYKTDIDMLDYIPSNDKRCKKIASQLFQDQYANNITNNGAIKLETPEVVGHLMTAMDLIEENDSEYLKIYNSILPKLHTIDMETLENSIYII